MPKVLTHEEKVIVGYASQQICRDDIIVNASWDIGKVKASKIFASLKREGIIIKLDDVNKYGEILYDTIYTYK